MKFLGGILILLMALLAPWSFGVNYAIPQSNATATYENSAVYTFSTNTVNTNIGAWERPFSHFVLSTNGSPIYAGSNFSLTIRAVDSNGYHVTFTNATKISIASLDSNSTPAVWVPTLTNLSVTNLNFLSVTTPDYNGVTLAQAYPVPGYIFVSVVQTNATNFLDPGLLAVMPAPGPGTVAFDRARYLGYGSTGVVTLVDGDRNSNFSAIDTVTVRLYSTTDPTGKTLVLYETGINTGIFTNGLAFEAAASANPGKVLAANNSQIYAEYTDAPPTNAFTTNALFSTVQTVLVTNPYFLPASRTTNVRLWGVSADGFTNEITSEYRLAASGEAGTTGAIMIAASNEVRTLAAGLGNALLINDATPSLSRSSVFLVTVLPSDAAVLTNDRLDLSVAAGSMPQELWLNARHTTNWIQVYAVSDQTSAVNQANGALVGNAALLPGTIQQVTAVDATLAETSAPFAAPVQVTLRYADADLTNGNVRYAESSLRVVRLEGGLWKEVPHDAQDTTNNFFRFKALSAGVYGLLSTSSKQPTNVSAVALYPNPFDMRKDTEMYILNLPPDVATVKIYAADSTLTKILTAPNDIGYKEIDGKVFRAARWDGTGRDGRAVKMGLYFIEISSKTGTVVKKLMFTR
ncbi:MAG: hypothetical protein J0L75_11320 [Spirochaetes bacterium]|nr:hypothetical protein [Spirochaetota bacterium]